MTTCRGGAGDYLADSTDLFWDYDVCLCVILKGHTVIISMQNLQCNGIQLGKAFECFEH